MASPGKAKIISRDSAGKLTVRTADIEGPAAVKDPRLREQLDLLSGQRLSQYSISIFGDVRLEFWGDATACFHQIYIEQQPIELTVAGQQPRRVPGRSEAIATALVTTLGHRLSRAEINDGRLRVAFDNDVTLAVSPHPQFESWHITSEDNLEIDCGPGGGLTIWYPDQDS